MRGKKRSILHHADDIALMSESEETLQTIRESIDINDVQNVEDKFICLLKTLCNNNASLNVLIRISIPN